MGKYILSVLLLIWLPCKSQDQLYYSPMQPGSNMVEFYKITADSSISYTRYYYGNGKEEISAGQNKITDKEAWRRFLNSVKPVSSIKTDTPEDFKMKMLHKTFLKEHYGEKDPLIFYGNSIILGTPTLTRNMRLAYPKQNPEPDNNFFNGYEFREINGIHFLRYNTGLYLLNSDTIIESIFPGSKITEVSDHIGNTAMASMLRINEENSLYGISDNIGKTVLPAKFQDIMICADAVLAKREDKWFFYDFFGKQISKKGYRKILPLSLVDLSFRQLDQLQMGQGGILKYAVLDGKNLKVIDDIYKESKGSKFSYQYGELSICGNRSGSWISQSLNLKIQKSNLVIKENAYFQNYPVTDIDGAEKIIKTEKTQAVDLNSSFGRLEFFTEKDSTSAYSYTNNRWVMLLKRVNNGKEYFYPIKFTKEEAGYFSIYKPFSEPEPLDKIEIVETGYSLLCLQGDYDYTYGFRIEDLLVNNNFNPNIYFKVTKDGKFGFYSPFSGFATNLRIKYKSLGNLEKRFMRFTDENGKSGWLSETNEEFYD